MTAYSFSQLVPYSSYPPKYEPGMLYAIDFEYTFGATIVTGDTFTTPSGALPSNGIRVMDTQLTFTPFDTNASPTGTVSIGDSGSATRFINAANAGSATSGAQLHLFIVKAQTTSSGVVSGGSGYLYAQGTDPQIIVTAGGVLATAASTGTMRLRVWFYCTGESS